MNELNETQNEKIEFTFSYLALKLLGKNLYSNAWAALSELVANGLDAKATKVFVYIDMRDKQNSIIEVFDNGTGMNYQELKNNYVKIGRNRRLDQGNSDTVMGRKGIGKLAALYLSRHYYVLTKRKDTELVKYEMNFTIEKEDSSNEQPVMSLASEVKYDNENFEEFDSGTMIRMEKVNLKGYADVSVDSLNKVLGDFFSIENLNSKELLYKVIQKDSDLNTEFKTVTKFIPYKNMVNIVCFDDPTYQRLNNKYGDNVFKIPLKKFENKNYIENIKISKHKLEQRKFKAPSSDENDKTEYNAVITGWMGIHASIDNGIARVNDENFTKNKLYNPLKLRVYVRNKLAIEDFLPTINNTQVFVNFIEGEVNFDLLDNNKFPDIATTSRQNMDENDERINYLATEMKKVVDNLIKSRQDIANKIRDKSNEMMIQSASTAKQIISEQIDKSLKGLNRFDNKSDSDDFKNTISTFKSDVLNNLKGETIKNKYMVFFSHSRSNKNIIDFFYCLLLNHGVKEKEMFYTSNSKRPGINLMADLEKLSKDCIIDTNTAMFFYITKDFRKSDYCMFEGGAAWATRSKDEFLLTFDNFKLVPDYLKSNKFILQIDKEFDLFSGDKYNALIQQINFIIKHINNGRKINLDDELSYFEEVEFPDNAEILAGKRPKLCKEIFEYWGAYIDDSILEKAKTEKYID